MTEGRKGKGKVDVEKEGEMVRKKGKEGMRGKEMKEKLRQREKRDT